jgi:hypothetical protein
MLLFSIGQSEFPRLEVNLANSAEKFNADDWLPVDVLIATHGFSGKVAISILFEEVLRFKEQLEPVYRDLKGKAEFRTLEGQLSIDINVDKFGHVIASGILKNDFSGDNELHFSLLFDQTSLRHTISEIASILSGTN